MSTQPTQPASHDGTPDDVYFDYFGGHLRSRRELAQECANLANQVANNGCYFQDGTDFRELIDEAAAHGERLAAQKAKMLLDVMRERDGLQLLVDYAAQLSAAVGSHTEKDADYWSNVGNAMRQFNAEVQRQRNSAYLVIAR